MITLSTLALLWSAAAIQPAVASTVRPDSLRGRDVQQPSAQTDTSATDSTKLRTNNAPLPATTLDSLKNGIGAPDKQDTTVRRRKAVVYSDAYGTRATIHRRLSYAMVPLFALSYFTGDKLFKDGATSSSLVIDAHRASATAVSVLFAVNAVTGGINLWQGRNDPIDRKRKLLHSALFIASSAGFTYAGAVLADQAERSLAKRQQHRQMTLISMGLSIGSVLVMMAPHD